MKLISREYSRTRVLGADRVTWSVFSLALALIISLLCFAYFYEDGHDVFKNNIVNLSCIQLEEMILSTSHESQHYIDDYISNISAVHNLRCK